jgi:hypothetical protein
MISTARLNRCHLLLCLTTVSLVAFCIASGDGVHAQDGASKDEIALKIEPPFAWNRTDRYEPPNYEAFFPDDVEGGELLDRMIEGKLEVAGIDRRLALIRRGLRNTSHHRTTLLGSVGNQFIWNRDEQDPRAIELMYHASASDDSGVAHYALYHGPTVVSQRTPNLVRMLMERYQSLDKQMQGRIAWGMKTYGDMEQTRGLLLDLLDDHDRLSAATIGATLDTYEAVFNTRPPEMERFDNVGQWVIAFHRTDLSADHPRAAEILRGMLDRPLRNRPEQLLNFVTRVDRGHETAVALVRGGRCRTDVVASLTRYANGEIDFNEMLSPRTLQERRLREFAKHLPDGLPKHAKPAYTRPPADEVYAYAAVEFVGPDFESFFADDAEAGTRLDEVYENRETIELSDRELLDLFRRGVRRSSHGPNLMFGWISSALGWPRDPALTEILYQGVDPNAPFEIRRAAIYYGFGLGTAKTKNILKAKFRVYMSPPFDRTTNGNMRGRILWGVRDHEDDKYYLATLFEEALRDHASLSDEALRQADRAYQQLTGDEPPNAAEYASRSVYLVAFADGDSRSAEESKQRVAQRLGESEHVVDIKCVENDGTIVVMVAVRGSAGMRWLIENLQTKPKMAIYFADLLTRELIDEAEEGMLRDFEKHLSTRPK